MGDKLSIHRIKSSKLILLMSSILLIFVGSCNSSQTVKDKESEMESLNNVIGIGVISINYVTNGEEDGILKFFKSLEDTIPIHQFMVRELDEAFRYKEDTMGVNPLEFMPTPGRIMFRCIDSTKQAYRIIINENSNAVCWLRKSGNIDFFNWFLFGRQRLCANRHGSSESK